MKKYLITGICCFLVFLLVAFATSASVQDLKTTFDINEGKILDLQNDIEIARTEKQKSANVILKNEIGADLERVAKDSNAADELMQLVFNWDTNAEYTKRRNQIMEDYDLASDSAFMLEFMPDMVVTSRDGTEYYPIDVMKLNATYDRVNVQLCSIAGDRYSYFAKVKWYVRGSTGTSESTESVFLFDTNSGGDILDLEAYNLR